MVVVRDCMHRMNGNEARLDGTADHDDVYANRPSKARGARPLVRPSSRKCDTVNLGITSAPESSFHEVLAAAYTLPCTARIVLRSIPELWDLKRVFRAL